MSEFIKGQRLRVRTASDLIRNGRRVLGSDSYRPLESGERRYKKLQTDHHLTVKRSIEIIFFILARPRTRKKKKKRKNTTQLVVLETRKKSNKYLYMVYFCIIFLH